MFWLPFAGKQAAVAFASHDRQFTTVQALMQRADLITPHPWLRWRQQLLSAGEAHAGADQPTAVQDKHKNAQALHAHLVSISPHLSPAKEPSGCCSPAMSVGTQAADEPQHTARTTQTQQGPMRHGQHTSICPVACLGALQRLPTRHCLLLLLLLVLLLLLRRVCCDNMSACPSTLTCHHLVCV